MRATWHNNDFAYHERLSTFAVVWSVVWRQLGGIRNGQARIWTVRRLSDGIDGSPPYNFQSRKLDRLRLSGIDPEGELTSPYCVCDSSTFAVSKSGSENCAYTQTPTKTLPITVSTTIATDIDNCKACTRHGLVATCNTIKDCTPKPTATCVIVGYWIKSNTIGTGSLDGPYRDGLSLHYNRYEGPVIGQSSGGIESDSRTNPLDRKGSIVPPKELKPPEELRVSHIIQC